MKVTLLKQVGDHAEGSEIEIKDQTVLETWASIGVIEKSEVDVDLTKLKIDDLKSIATEKELPVEEWEGLKKEELVKYLSDK